MLNLAVAMMPARRPELDDAEEGFIGKLVLWARHQLRYLRSLQALNSLDERDLDALALTRGDLPSLARRHAEGKAPLPPSQIAGLRRL